MSLPVTTRDVAYVPSKAPIAQGEAGSSSPSPVPFAPHLYGLNYHRWKICAPGRRKGEALGLPLYRFLAGPLVRRFGKAWYDELCQVAKELGF